ncbi:hypothetical protein ACTSKR_15365 [Chitinibacteraceae bacterium HSL-7]
MGILRQNQFVRRWMFAWRETGACLALGLRDAFSGKVLAYSILLVLLATGVMIWFYYYYAPVPLILSGWMGAIAIFGGGVAVSAGPGGVGSFNVVALGHLLWLAVLAAGMASLFYVLLFAFGVLLQVLLFLPVTVLPPAVMRITPRYREMDVGLSPLPTSFSCGWLLGQVGWLLLIGLVCLIVPLVAGLLLLGVLATFNLLLLYAATLRALPEPKSRLLALRWRWRPMSLIGFVLLALTFIPVVNLLVPALMCTTMIHLACRNNRYCLAKG